MAGIRPANAPIRMAEAMPPDHASAAITTGPALRAGEIWLGPEDEPRALPVRTNAGRRGLLAVTDIVALVPEQEWVVVPSQPRMLELGVPHLEAADDSRVAATWRTTGAALSPPPAPGRAARATRWLGLRTPPRAFTAGAEPKAELPLWQSVALLYASLAVIVATVITLAFLNADIETGHAY